MIANTRPELNPALMFVRIFLEGAFPFEGTVNDTFLNERSDTDVFLCACVADPTVKMNTFFFNY
jgi:hypothetical protein